MERNRNKKLNKRFSPPKFLRARYVDFKVFQIISYKATLALCFINLLVSQRMKFSKSIYCNYTFTP